jgi:hypothetical protein
MEQLTFKIFFQKFEKLSAATVIAAAKKGVKNGEIFLTLLFHIQNFLISDF